LKILGFCNVDFAQPWGDSVRVGGLMGGLAARGHEIQVISSRPEFNISRPQKTWMPQGGIRVHETMFGGWMRLPPPVDRPNSFVRRSCASLLMTRKAEELSAKWKFDACYALMPGIASSLPAIRFSRKHCCKMVLDFPDLDVFIRPKAVSKFSVRNSDAVLVVSDFMRQVVKSYGAPEAKVHYVPNGVDPEMFGPEKARGELAALLGSRKKVLYAGSLQDIDVLLGAAKLLAKRRPEVAFVVVGDNHLRGLTKEDWKSKADRCGLGGSFLFTGKLPRERMPGLMAEADVCVETMGDRPYFQAAQPIKILEYMASGRPVVAPDLSGIRGVIKDGEDGFLARAGDSEDFANKIERLLESEDLRRTLGANARSAVLKGFTWKKAAEALERVLETTAA
jgi:glycosyltransferase involved in cell wall biosynthesis